MRPHYASLMPYTVSSVQTDQPILTRIAPNRKPRGIAASHWRKAFLVRTDEKTLHRFKGRQKRKNRNRITLLAHVKIPFRPIHSDKGFFRCKTFSVYIWKIGSAFRKDDGKLSRKNLQKLCENDRLSGSLSTTEKNSRNRRGSGQNRPLF